MSKTILKQKLTQENVLLDISGLHKKYNEGQKNEVHVLKGLDLQINKGEMVAIMGPSGCGKTTLLNVMGGLDGYSSGLINLAGQSLHELNDKELTEFRRDNIGFIFQLFNLFDTQTALDNVTLPLLLRLVSPKLAKTKAKLMLQEVGLGDRLNAFPAQLSGGEQQKVAISRAIINDPTILLADEPTGDLDNATSDDIMALFRRMIYENPDMGIIIVTHSSQIAEKCDRIVRIKNGTIASEERRN